MFGSVAQLCLTLQTHGLQHARPPCPSPTPGACSNSCPLSWWCYPTISPSVVPFSSCPQSFPASGAFPMSQLLTSGSQSIGVSASASVLPMNIQDWFSWRLTGLNSLYSKELSRVFSNTTVQKYPFFSTQLSLWSNSYTPRVQFKCSPVSERVGTLYSSLSFNKEVSDGDSGWCRCSSAGRRHFPSSWHSELKDLVHLKPQERARCNY